MVNKTMQKLWLRRQKIDNNKNADELLKENEWERKNAANIAAMAWEAKMKYREH